MDFRQKMQQYREWICAGLETIIPDDTVEPLKSSMRYSLLAGGKRLRPVLCLAANALKDGDPQEALPIALAIEMIHTYSLIHDDLPAMDDDQLRRGKPTNHVVFGEAMAILAGDGLLTHAMEWMMQGAARYPDNLAAHCRAISCVVQAAGVRGMVAGQCLDLEAEGKSIRQEELYAIHERKTGALIKAPLLAGLYLCAPQEQEVRAVSEYGEKLGLCFQIVDDILDVQGDEKKLGKTVGKDAKEDKLTFPKLYGVEKSRQMVREYTQQGIDALHAVFGQKAEFLVCLAQQLIDREM